MGASGRKVRRLAVTNSEVGTWQTCRQRWWFKYHEGLRQRSWPRYFGVGSAAHAGIAAAYDLVRRHQAGETARPDERALVDAALAASHAKLMGWLRRLEEHGEGDADEKSDEAEAAEREARIVVDRFVRRFVVDDMDRFDVLGVEVPFEVPLRDAAGRRIPASQAGVLDLVLRDRELGDVVVGEHKSTSGNASEADLGLDMDPQTTTYVWAARELLRSGAFDGSGPLFGLPADALSNTTVGRVAYNVVRKRAPRLPSWNKPDKNGVRLVSSAAVETTRDIYQAALDRQREQHGVEPTEKQLARLAQLPSSDDRWIARHEHHHSADELERWRRERVAESAAIRRALDEREPVTRNVGACNPPWAPRCLYRSICRRDTPEGRREFEVVDDPHGEVREAEGRDGAEEAA